MDKQAKTKIWLSSVLLLVFLTASVYFIYNDEVRIDITKTRSIFKVYEDGEWVVSGIEYTNIFDGTAKMRAKNRSLDTVIGEDNRTKVTRIANYKDGISTIEIYTFDAQVEDVELFPISHSIEVINGEGKLLQYEVQKLLYTGETVKDIESPQSFGHKMKVEWEDGNYYSRIWKYSGKDEGKLTVKYRVDSSDYIKDVRLFDPVFYTYEASILVVAGGGAGAGGTAGVYYGAGAGGGTVIENNSYIISSTPYSVTVGAGGSGYLSAGGDSVFGIHTAGGGIGPADNTQIGGANDDYTGGGGYGGDSGAGAGGGANGGDATSVIYGGTGGIGVDSSISGSSVCYAGGGGGGAEGTATCGGGAGAGGGAGDAGTNGLGGGGGGGKSSTYGSGGSGIVIISYPTNGSSGILNTSTGGTITTSGGYTIHTFTSNGTFTPSLLLPQVLVLNAPINNLNSTNNTIIFNGTVTALANFTNVSLYIDSTLNETNSSGINNSDYIFTKTLLDGEYIWYYISCSEFICSQSNNRNLLIDTVNPIISLEYPDNITYNVKPVELNFSYTETNPALCWYSLDGGDTNVTTGCFTNIDGIEANEGNNNWTIWINDSAGREANDSVTFFVDIVSPLIEYNTNSDTTNQSGNFTDKNWIFINVSVTEVNVANVTFLIWTSTNSSFNETIFTTQADSYSINLTDLDENMYFWNVTVIDIGGNINSTEERRYGIENINITLELNAFNIDAELGGDILVNATNTLDTVYIDVDHPSYGTNYSSGLWKTGFDLIISWFRNTVFTGVTSFNYTSGFGTDENKTFNLSAHQYDEIVNVSLNITGTNNPLGVAFYKANSTEYDRVFFGNLTSAGHIQQDSLIVEGDYNTTQNISWDNKGTKYLYFLLDDNAKLINFLLNISSISYGFSFTDIFDTDNYADKVLSNASYNGFIRPGFIETSDFEYDNFSVASINTTRWTPALTGGGDIYGGDGYDATYSTSISGSSLYTYVDLERNYNCVVSDHDGYLNYDVNSNITQINLYAIDGLEFELNFYSYYREESLTDDSSSADCDENSAVKIGGNSIWTPYDKSCMPADNGGSCTGEITTPTELTFNITRQISNTWNVKISGVEVETSFRDETCGNYVITTNWTSGERTSVFESCTDTVTSVNNNFNISASQGSSVLTIHTAIDTSFERYNDPNNGCYGCDSITSWTKLDNVNYTLPNYLNNTGYYSTSIFDSSYDVAKVTPTVIGTGTGSGVNSTLTYFVSGDNGDNWQNFVSGVDTPLTNPGKHMKWAVSLSQPESGYTMDIPIITSVDFQAEPSNLSNLTFDFGNDGIIDYNISGDFTPDNGTVQINLTSSILSDSFTGSPIVGHTYKVPLIVSSDSAGTLAVDNINLTYNPNPVFLNYTSIQNFLTSFGSATTIIPMLLEASGLNSIVNLTGLLFDYAGGNDTIEVLAHNADYSQNVSRNITYYYSRWDYSFVPEDINGIWFGPKSSTENDTTPYGQSSTTPILNITNYGYGGLNATLSIYQKDTPSCVNTTLSLDNNKSNGYLITDNWTELTNMSYLDTVDIYLWADYDCDYSTWYSFQPNYYFRQCVDGGVCSTDII